MKLLENINEFSSLSQNEVELVEHHLFNKSIANEELTKKEKEFAIWLNNQRDSISIHDFDYASDINIKSIVEPK